MMRASVAKPAAFHTYAFLGIVVLSLVLRLVGITGPFTGSRDWQSSFYTLVGSGRSLGTYNKWPPLTETMYAVAISLFGAKEWSVRIIPVLLSVGTVVLLYFFLRDLFGAHLAAIGSAFLAVSPGDVYYSTIVSYHFFLVLSIWMFYQWANTGSRWAGSLACGSALIGTGFNYSALPIILVPVAYVSSVFRSYAKALVLVGLTVGEVLVWLGYLGLSGTFSDLRLGIATDNVSWLFSRENLAEWIRMAGTFVWHMALPVVVLLSAVWLLALLREGDKVRRMREGLVFWWFMGVVAWATATPRHAATHDIWWIVMLPPMSAAGALGLAVLLRSWLLKSRVIRVAAFALLVAFVTYGSWQTLAEYRRAQYLDNIVGETLRTHVSGGIVIGDSPAAIWYAGSQGYTWKYFAQVSGQDGLEEVLVLQRPAAVLISDALARDWQFWGDAPPYAQMILSKFGYVAAWRMWNALVYFREPPLNLIAKSTLWEPVGLRPDGWIPYQLKGLIPVVRFLETGRPDNGLLLTASSFSQAVIYQAVAAEQPGHYLLGALIDAGRFDGRIRVQLSFVDGHRNWIAWDDSPEMTWGQGPRTLAVAATAPLGACKVQANIRIEGTGTVVVKEITLTRLSSGVVGVRRESVATPGRSESRCGSDP